MPETLIDQVARHEGLRLKPYLDSVGRWTIGYGRNLTDCGITADEAVGMLERDLNAAAMDLMTFPWFPVLNSDDLARSNALINMRFNLGGAGFRRFKVMISCLERGDYAGAAAAMRHSKWYRQVGARGEELARLVETGA